MSVAEAAPAEGPAAGKPSVAFVFAGLMLVLLMAALDQTIVSTALPTIVGDLGGLNHISWVVTAYLLAQTAVTPVYGKLGDLYGRKVVLQAGLVVFLVGSALCGLSQNLTELIAFRALQGLGGGGLIVSAQAAIGDVVSPRERGRYQGYFGAVFGASSVLGPLIGGFLVDYASWRYVFYVNIPIGIIALLVINRVLHLDHKPRRAHIDWTGALLLVVGMSLLLVGVQEAGQKAAITSSALTYAISGLVIVIAFVAWETRATEPILPLRLFSNKVFAVANALGLITGAVMFGAIIFLPQYLQTVRGVSPTLSGLRLLPLLAGVLIASIGSGRLISRRGTYKKYVIAGTAITTVGIALLTRITVTTNVVLFSAMIFVVGIGLGLFMQTLVLAVQNSIDPADMGVGTSAVTFFRTLGGAIGASVLGAILIEQEKVSAAHYVSLYGPKAGPLHAFTHGMDQAYLWAVPVAVIAFGLSFLLREIKLRGGGPPAPAGPAAPDDDASVGVDAGRSSGAVVPGGETTVGAAIGSQTSPSIATPPGDLGSGDH